MPNPDYATLLPLIAAETDPVARQALIDECYQFNEPLTPEEQGVFQYIQYDYVSDVDQDYPGYTEYVGAYYDPDGTPSNSQQPRESIYIESVTIIGDTDTALESDFGRGVVYAPISVVIRSSRVLDYDISVRVRYTSFGGVTSSSLITIPAGVDSFTHNTLMSFRVFDEYETSAYFGNKPITFNLESATIPDLPGATVDTGDDFEFVVVDDRPTTEYGTLTFDLHGRTQTTTTGSVRVSIPTVPRINLLGYLRITSGVTTYTYTFTYPAFQPFYDIPVILSQGSAYYATQTSTVSVEIPDADEEWDNLIIPDITIN